MIKFDWSPLDVEFKAWRDAQITLPIWWRDDDAIEPTPALERLTTLSRDIEIPVHIAVIPKFATPALAALDAFAGATPTLIPLPHGFAHENHATAGNKKAEFGPDRAIPAASQDIKTAFTTLKSLFGDALVPMFVPPWNRIAPALFPVLAAAGYTALSTFTPRRAAYAAPNITQINTHLDPIAWHAGRSLASPETLIAQLVQDLQDRRFGRTDNTEPYGLLTHHLVHDEKIWNFTATLLGRLRNGPTTIYRANRAPRKS